MSDMIDRDAALARLDAISQAAGEADLPERRDGLRDAMVAIRALPATPAPDAGKVQALVSEVMLAFENADVQLGDEGEFTERAWEQLRAALAAMKEG